MGGGLDPDSKRYEPQRFFVPWKRRLVSAASGFSGLGRPRVALGKPSSLDLNRLVPALLRRRHPRRQRVAHALCDHPTPHPP